MRDRSPRKICFRESAVGLLSLSDRFDSTSRWQSGEYPDRGIRSDAEQRRIVAPFQEQAEVVELTEIIHVKKSARQERGHVNRVQVIRFRRHEPCPTGAGLSTDSLGARTFRLSPPGDGRT